MDMYINRTLATVVGEKLRSNPAVGIIGPRQCGKSTLAAELAKMQERVVYLDLERPSDLNQLREPELFFSHNGASLIILDEIQRVPDLFPVIRATIDTNKRNGQFLILGSASPKLIRQSSETLAGRIAYVELTPFLLREAMDAKIASSNFLDLLWLRGGFPRSFLAKTDVDSFDWRLDFIRTFLEQDIPNLGVRIPASNLSRFWRMFAHVNGKLLNGSKLAASLGVSGHTVRSYIDLLSDTFMLRVIEPYASNNKKRMVKSPKVYIRDSGLLHALLDIETMNELFAHPCLGDSWEGFVIEQILALSPRFRASFYRSKGGNEIDLILQHKQERIAVECKSSQAPKVGPGLAIALTDLDIDKAWIIAPVRNSYPYSQQITVSPLPEFLDFLRQVL